MSLVKIDSKSGARQPASAIYNRLRAIQEERGYLPQKDLERVAESFGMPVADLHKVASYYPHFQLRPPPQLDVAVCSDLACHVHGAGQLCQSIEQTFAAIGPERLKVRKTSCFGHCDGAPAVAVNDHIYSNVRLESLQQMLWEGLDGKPLPHPSGGPARQFRSDPYTPGNRYTALRRLAESKDFAGILTSIRNSGLAGMGGAGVPTAKKWQEVIGAASPEKYVVCNGDESEPGSFKDRFILENLPHLVIEGLIICGLTVGARKAFLYIRHEYERQRNAAAEELERCRRERLVGENILGSGLSLEFEIFVSPGGYICGEATALIEAIQGNRAEPRNKPPSPGIVGLWNQPTVVNNVETLANVPQVLMRPEGEKGWKFATVSGDVRRPGVFEVPLGTPARDVIEDMTGGITGCGRLKAFSPSGPSSGFLPASLAATGLDFKPLRDVGSMLGSAGIVAYSDDRCIVDLTLNALTFFRNESCGKCVPCRLGCQKMVDIVTRWTEGLGSESDFAVIADLEETLRMTSICGLGQFAHAPLTSALTHFREEIDAHVIEHRCPSQVCPMKETSPNR